MKHYSEIIKKAFEESNEKCDTKKNKPQKKEKMNTMTYSLYDVETSNLKNSMFKISTLRNMIKEDTKKLHIKVSKIFFLIIRLSIRIIGFMAFLIRIILKSTLRF